MNRNEQKRGRERWCAVQPEAEREEKGERSESPAKLYGDLSAQPYRIHSSQLRFAATGIFVWYSYYDSRFPQGD